MTGVVRQHLHAESLSETVEVDRLLQFPITVQVAFRTLQVHVIGNCDGHCLAMAHAGMPVLPRDVEQVAESDRQDDGTAVVAGRGAGGGCVRSTGGVMMDPRGGNH